MEGRVGEKRKVGIEEKNNVGVREKRVEVGQKKGEKRKVE